MSNDNEDLYHLSRMGWEMSNDNEDLEANFKQCPMFDHHGLITVIHEDLKGIKEEIAKMNEIIEAWDNAKGFIKTIRILGEVVKWLVAVGAAIAAIWWWLKK